jgi:iduronate 2-sulfatase
MKSSAWLLSLLVGATAMAAETPRPNVLLICIDDLKPTLGCYGDRHAQSPNIDRLAARGVLFEAAYCNQAVCSPSRNALLAGLRSQTLGIYDLGTNFRKSVPNAVTLPQYFMQHGYRAEAMGKLFHVGHGNNEDAASWSVPHWRAQSIGYVLPENRAQTTREEARFSNQPEQRAAQLPRGAAYESADVPDNEYADGKLADEAVRRLHEHQTRSDDQRFFMAVGFVKPHLPFCAPKKYWDLYDPQTLPMPERSTPPDGAPDFGPTNWGELRQYKDMPERGPLTPEQTRTLIHGYYAATSYVDAQVGRVLDALDATGFAQNTIVVLWGDHGWHLGDHGQWCKHTNYEQAARIPVIVAAPGAKAGVKTGALIESVDIYPTLAALAGLPAPIGLDGRSFVPTLNDPAVGGRDHAIHVYPRGNRIGRAIRTERYRLVEWKVPGESPDTAVLELYDYVADPGETANLAAKQPEVVARLRTLLAKHPEAKPQIRPGTAATTPAPANSKPRQDRAAMFARRDKNNDGVLSREEFLASQPDPDDAPARFLRFDANKDGVLSREEFVHQGKVP